LYCLMPTIVLFKDINAIVNQMFEARVKFKVQ